MKFQIYLEHFTVGVHFSFHGLTNKCTVMDIKIQHNGFKNKESLNVSNHQDQKIVSASIKC
jgi:hypothetical protein